MTATVVSHENAVTPEAESIPTRNPHRSPVNPYVRMIAVRFAQMIPTAVIASFLTFALVRIIPGGPAEALLGPNGSDESIAALNERLGLNQPLLVQYWNWVVSALHGDLGTSLQNSAPVGPQIFARLPASAELVVLALLLSAVVAIPLGVWTATRQGRRSDGLTRTISGIGLAVPDFFLAIVLVDVFALGLGVLPVLGWVPLGDDVIANLSHLVLPATALAAGAASIAVRQTRAAMIETLSGDYVRTARAMGIDERKIVWRYALRNIVPTIVTVYGLLAVAMLGATVILEQVFVLPGLGSALVIAIDTRDYPMLQGIVLLFVVIVLLVNILVDIVNNMISPQLRKGTIS
ncbi:ABC transporter permease [Rhodococcus baikonurensis]